MIISPGRGYIFVHIPKTGGTALSLALENRAMRDDILIGDTPKAVRRRGRLKDLAPRGRLWKHSRLADIEGILTPDEIARMFVFAIVRNPWDRMVSYYHWLRGQGFDHPAVVAAKAMPFADFVMDADIGESFRRHPYASYVAGGRDPIFIRLERLAEDLAPFESLLGFALEMPQANRTERDRDWRGYYDPATRDRVAAICADDIARFGYGFDDAPMD